MILLDPFYGVFRTGKVIAKWLNRALILAEGAAVYFLIRELLIVDVLEPWHWLLVIPGVILALHIVNSLVRGLWNIVLVFVYGTTDAETILEQRQDRADRRLAVKRRLNDAAEAARRRKEDYVSKEDLDFIRKHEITPDSD